MLRAGFINDVKADEKGIWVAAHKRLFYWNGNDSLKTEVINPFTGICNEVEIKTLFIDRQQRLWSVCDNNTILVLNRSKGKISIKKIEPIPAQAELNFIYEDKAHRLWVGTWGQGLWQLKYDEDGEKTGWIQHKISNIDEGREDNLIFDMEEANGLLWLLTYKRLHALKYIDNEIHDLNISDVMPTNKMFTDMISDRDGNLWLSAYDDGYIIHFNSHGLSNFRISGIKSLINHDANLKGILSEGKYAWLNQDRYGILLLNTETGEIKPAESLPTESSNIIHSTKKNSIWVASRYGCKVYRLTNTEKSIIKSDFTDFDSIADNAGSIINLHEDRNSNLWILTGTSLFVRKQNGTILTGNSHSEFTNMVSDNDNNGIICISGNNILRFYIKGNSIESKKIANISFLSENEIVRLITLDSEKQLWLCTSFGRIVVIDKANKECVQSSLMDMLTGEEIQSIKANGHTIWVMTDKRLVGYNVKSNTYSTYFAGQENLCVKRFLLHTLDINNQNVVYAGGYGGFVRISPSSNSPTLSDTNEPIVTNILLNGKSIFFSSEYNKQNSFRYAKLPCNAHDVKIYLSTLHYTFDNNNKMQYKLEGVDNEWRDVDSFNPYAFYNSLPRGEHRLFVRILGENDTWGEPTEIMMLERTPKWFETWWAFSAYILCAIILAVVIAVYVHKRHKQKLHTEVTQAKMTVLSTSHVYTDKIINIVNSHIDDSKFGVEELANELNTSKSTIHRKIKAEIDMTPLELINSIRLKKACELLSDNSLNVSEVAYKVGFSSPKYFTQCFKAEYGVTPSDYRKHNNN